MRQKCADNLSKEKHLPVVLIVEDDEGLRKLIRKVIVRHGFTTDYASSGPEVMEKVRARPHTILLLDYMLPDTTGKKIIMQLQKQGCMVPFVIMTGHGDERVAVEMMKLGARDYVVKDKDFLEILPEVVKKISAELEKDLALASTRHALSKREKALAAVYTIATNTGKSYRELCEYSSEKLAEILCLSSVVTYIVEQRQVVAFARYTEGRMYRHEGSEFPCAACEKILNNQETLQLTGDFSEKLVDCTCFSPSYHSFVAVPIKNESKAQGMICAFDTEEKTFSSDDLQLIDLFAHYLSHEIDQKNMEDEVRQSREMKILGQLTSGVAHEVRNPLNAINAMIEAMFEDFKHNDAVEPYKFHISAQVQRLSRLMQDLLDLGKPVDRENVAELPLGTISLAIADMWKKTSGTAHRVEFRDEEKIGDVEILMDKSKLQQVLINLLENASQHSPKDSCITLEISRAGDGFVAFKVIDQGCGISREHMGNVFEPFFTTRRQGTGLGLSIVRHIVTTHGGAVNAYNNPDEPGSTFEITLPIGKKEDYRKPREPRSF